MWIGIVHHVVNEHEWMVEEGINGGMCHHDPLTDAERNKPWLKKGSPAHTAMSKIVLDKRFLNTIPYYTNFRYLPIYCQNSMYNFDSCTCSFNSST
jgi:hypothetical protein